MNRELARLAGEAGFDAPESEPLRLAFGLACVERVKHLLEEPRAVECLDVLRAFVAGQADAAVSATCAVANAAAGRALDAASYAAYASVYGYGGYAVSDPSAFQGEYEWQLGKLRDLSQERTPAWKR